jgi:hypothetical protein
MVHPANAIAVEIRNIEIPGGIKGHADRAAESGRRSSPAVARFRMRTIPCNGRYGSTCCVDFSNDIIVVVRYLKVTLCIKGYPQRIIYRGRFRLCSVPGVAGCPCASRYGEGECIAFCGIYLTLYIL